MYFTLRKDDCGKKKTDVAIDINEYRIVLSDWECSPGVEAAFGMEDLEWNYEIPLSEVGAVNRALERFTRENPKPDLTEEEAAFCRLIEDASVKTTFTHLVSYFRIETRALWLAKSLIAEGIPVKE